MIRFADIKDFDKIISMMESFANAAPVEAYHDPVYNLRGVQNYLASVSNNGCIIVAENEHGEVSGMLIAQICADPWLPQVKNMREVAWWVEPDYRHTSMGYRLLMKYVEVGKNMKQNGIIDNFVLTTMINSPDLNLQKRGWRPIETNYVYEGA
jgi:hypothetical protein